MHWFINKLRRYEDDVAIIEAERDYYNTYTYDVITNWALLPRWMCTNIIYVPTKLSWASLSYLITGIEEGKIIVLSKEKLGVIKSNPLFDKVRCGIVLVTSGSTGKPKRILHDMDKLLEAHRNASKALRTIAFLKFDHIGGLNTVLYTLSAGGTLIVPKSLGVEDVCSAIEKYKAELLPTAPSFLNLLLSTGAHERYDLSSLKIISFGTEPMPDSLLERLRHTFPDAKLKQTYGMSELGIISNHTNPDDPNFIKLNADIKVVDGKLFVKSPTAMVGYLDQDNPIDEDGWLDTGDVVEEKDGYIRIIGREDDVINVGGMKVYPQEVEDIIMQIPFVKSVLVYGKDNPLLGGIVCAKATVEGQDVGAEMLIKDYCEQNLEKYKVPMRIEIVDSIPVSERGKKVRR